jgi:hypothetical protein
MFHRHSRPETGIFNARGQDHGHQVRRLLGGQGNPGLHELDQPEDEGHKRQANGERMVKQTARTDPAPTGKGGVHTKPRFCVSCGALNCRKEGRNQ